MPLIPSLARGVLSIVTVGMGVSLGREAAPQLARRCLRQPPGGLGAAAGLAAAPAGCLGRWGRKSQRGHFLAPLIVFGLLGLVLELTRHLDLLMAPTLLAVTEATIVARRSGRPRSTRPG